MALLWLLSCFTLIGASYGSEAPASKPELNIKPRIVNSTDTLPGSLSWLVAVTTTIKVQFCGGSLIHRNWVITAAHCNVTTSDVVVAGLHDPHSTKNDIQILKVAQVFLHPRLNWNILDYDIALLKLARPARLSKTVSPVFLPTASDRTSSGRLCLTVGWGFTHPNASMHPKQRQQAMVPLLNNTECRMHWGNTITDAKICAGVNGASCWEVDSGAPLVCRKKRVWNLVGVMSSMSESCPTLKPLVFTRVTKIMPWIQETMANK